MPFSCIKKILSYCRLFFFYFSVFTSPSFFPIFVNFFALVGNLSLFRVQYRDLAYLAYISVFLATGCTARCSDENLVNCTQYQSRERLPNFRFMAAVDFNKCLKQIELPITLPRSAYFFLSYHLIWVPHGLIRWAKTSLIHLKNCNVIRIPNKKPDPALIFRIWITTGWH